MLVGELAITLVAASRWLVWPSAAWSSAIRRPCDARCSLRAVISARRSVFASRGVM